jgi:hypothetical protein
MTTTGIVILLATIVSGIVVGLMYLQRLRRPKLVTLHLCLALASGALALALVALAPARSGGPPSLWLVLLLALAIGGGYGAMRLPRLRRAGREAILVAHVFLGVASFFVLLAWIGSLG